MKISDSIKIHGKSSTRVVVMLMGRGAPGKVWNAFQVPALVAEGYQVVTFDNRGSGIFSAITTPFTLQDMVDDTISIISSLGKKVFLVGTSLGARIAQEVSLARPDLIQAQFLAAAHARILDIQKKYSLEQYQVRTLLCDTNKNYLALQTILDNFSFNFIANNQNNQDWFDMIYHSIKKPSIGEKFQTELDINFDRRKEYKNIITPTLCLAYQEDKIIYPQLVREIANTIPNSEYHELKYTGHYGYLENPEQFNFIMNQFLNQF